MKFMLITVIILSIGHTVYSETCSEYILTQDDLADGIIPIISNLSITICNRGCPLKHIFRTGYIQNIGEVPAVIQYGTSTNSTSYLLYPLETPLPLEISTCLEIFFSRPFSYSNRAAILYIPEYKNDDKLYIKDIQKDFDKINRLKKTFTLGVTQIPKEHLTLKTLISSFWHENKTDVWEQLFKVVGGSLNQFEQTYEFINKDLEDINKEMVALAESEVTDFPEKYMHLTQKIYNIRKLIAVPRIDQLYVLPIYNNVITMAMYFLGIGVENPEMCEYNTTIFYNFANYHDMACFNIIQIQEYSIQSIYETVNAAGAFNVLMNAYNYIAFHGLKQLPIWEKIASDYNIPDSYRSYNCRTLCRDPISYSNLYGKATANLLQEAIHINDSPLSSHCNKNDHKAAKLRSIVIYLRQEIQSKIVYGLTLEFSPVFTTSMGCTKTSMIIKKHKFNFANFSIINLKVYRTQFIRCLEFTLSNETNIIFGNHCGEEFKEFRLKDHYINSLYLANDYPETEEYFDNIAVSFLPNTL